MEEPEVEWSAVGALCVGEALIDVVQHPDGEPDEHSGGNSLNVSVALGRLERPVAFATWFAQDRYGAMIRKHLNQSNVALLPGSQGAERTSTATATLDAEGKASYTFDLSFQVPPLPAELRPLVVQAGSISATLLPGADDVLATLASLKEQSTIVYDPNIRPTIIGDRDLSLVLVHQFVQLSDIVKVSDEDLEWLYPFRTAEESARDWADTTGCTVILTAGPNGATVINRAGSQLTVPAAGINVVDTIGAGDTFAAAMIDALWTAGLLGATHRTELADLSIQRWRPILECAVRAAGITVSRAGANPPWLAELKTA
jgi:fructokinase